MDMAIADAGATGHFVLPCTPVTDLQIATKPLVINLLDGDQIKSTHTCELMVPWLPKNAKRAYIVPGLAHISLIYISRSYVMQHAR